MRYLGYGLAMILGALTAWWFKPTPVSAPVVAKDLQSLRMDFESALSQGDLTSAGVLVSEMERFGKQTVAHLECASRLYLRQENWPQAKRTLKTCLQYYPRSRLCLVELAGAELKSGTIAEQDSAVRFCLSMIPGDPDCKRMAETVKLNRGR